MKKRILLILTISMNIFCFGQNPWQSVASSDIPHQKGPSFKLAAESEAYFSLDKSQLVEQLEKAPFREEEAIGSPSISFPTQAAQFHQFTFYKTRTLSPALAAKFPEIQSFVGITEDKKQRIRVTLTPAGVFGMLTEGKQTTYINPLHAGSNYYQLTKRTQLTAISEFTCLITDELTTEKTIDSTPVNHADVDDATLRTYDLAVATTGEYAEFHVNNQNLQGAINAQKKAGVLSAIVTAIDRVNEIYERDFAVSLTLVPNNDQLIYLNSFNDPFSNFNPNQLIDESQNVIDNIIGSSNYDIGHTFSTGGGGLAALGSVCTNLKASGITGSFQPIGDPYVVDYVCHEMGHQFGAEHTFNSSSNNCAAQEEFSTAVEPGSGSTIMGYAGLCSGDNVQTLSDPYFHAKSIEQVFNNISINVGSICADETSIANTAPVINPIPNYVIPRQTPFVLEGNATDANGDNLSYTWEQYDANSTVASPPSSFSSQGPLFRSVPPSSDNKRYFPDFETVLESNATVPGSTFEVLPGVNRFLSFRLTVRDNNINGGQSSYEDVGIEVKNNGPFKVTSQNTTGIIYNENATVTVTWDVAGTDANEINTSEVSILLAFDGENFNDILVQNTPNDGSEDISFPTGTLSTNCRIMVKAVDNIFFAVNRRAFEITDEMSLPVNRQTNFALYPNPNTGKFTIQLKQLSENSHVQVFDLQGRLIYKNTLERNLHEIQLNHAQPGMYLVKVDNGEKSMVQKIVVE